MVLSGRCINFRFTDKTERGSEKFSLLLSSHSFLGKAESTSAGLGSLWWQYGLRQSIWPSVPWLKNQYFWELNFCSKQSGRNVSKRWRNFEIRTSVSLCANEPFHRKENCWQCCQFLLYSKVTQSHTHTYIYVHSFSHNILHRIPSEVTRYSLLCCTAGSHCLSTPNAIVY